MNARKPDPRASRYRQISVAIPVALTQYPTTGVAIDPVSGKEVDKAEAVIGIDKAGNVYFFQSEENLKKFRVPAGG
jgi:YHS domain-containing protein